MLIGGDPKGNPILLSHHVVADTTTVAAGRRRTVWTGAPIIRYHDVEEAAKANASRWVLAARPRVRSGGGKQIAGQSGRLGVDQQARRHWPNAPFGGVAVRLRRRIGVMAEGVTTVRRCSAGFSCRTELGKHASTTTSLPAAARRLRAGLASEDAGNRVLLIRRRRDGDKSSTSRRPASGAGKGRDALFALPRRSGA